MSDRTTDTSKIVAPEPHVPPPDMDTPSLDAPDAPNTPTPNTPTPNTDTPNTDTPKTSLWVVPPWTWAKFFSWIMIGFLISFLLLTPDVRYYNPALREGAPYLYNVTAWELENAPRKWFFLAKSALPWIDESDRELETLAYFDINSDLSQARSTLRAAAAHDLREESAKLQHLFDEVVAHADSLSGGAEETIESYISAELIEEDLGLFGGALFPPVDVRLVRPPKLLIVSPRDRIERKHETLLQADMSLDERETIEQNILQNDDMSALVENIGGLATYPASVATGFPIRWTMQTAAHEWLHHYFFFKPLGQHMFDDPDMLRLNETIANVAGDEIGDRAYVAMVEGLRASQLSGDNSSDGNSGDSDSSDSGDGNSNSGDGDSGDSDSDSDIDSASQASSNAPAPADTADAANPDDTAPAADTADPDPADTDTTPFDFDAEMRETRLGVEVLLADGRIEDAETYMENRRLLFVVNGYSIRKLNQAYFAFYGTYADLPASVSPIGDQVRRMRQLVPNLGDFLRTVGEFSSYDEFLTALDALENGAPEGVR